MDQKGRVWAWPTMHIFHSLFLGSSAQWSRFIDLLISYFRYFQAVPNGLNIHYVFPSFLLSYILSLCQKEEFALFDAYQCL